MVDYSAIAVRLRELHESRQWTLDEAARASGLTPSTISRLETNRRVPSLEHLVGLSAAYGVALTDLLPPAVADPRIRVHARRIDGATWRMLSAPGSPMRTVEIVLRRRARRNTQQSHAGREWFYVASGVVELTLGDERLTMRAGEAAEFDTRLPHAFDAQTESVTVIVIFDENGRRIHMHNR